MRKLDADEKCRLLLNVVQDYYADHGAVWLAEVLELVGEQAGWLELNSQSARAQRAAERVRLLREYRKWKACPESMTIGRVMQKLSDDALLELQGIIRRRVMQGSDVRLAIAYERGRRMLV